MTKSLHEQLRSVEPSPCTGEALEKIQCGEADCALTCSECIRAGLGALADRIENEYLLLPCDPAGKPWKIDDPVITSNHDEATVVGYLFDGEEWFLSCRFSDDMTVHEFVSSCKRPDPPVLDKDGVEIKVRDKVWDIESGEELTVEGFPNRECGLVQCSDENGGCDDHDAHNLTHKESDSLEKLLKRMEDYAQMYEGYIDGSKVGDFSKELRALIERGDNA